MKYAIVISIIVVVAGICYLFLLSKSKKKGEVQVSSTKKEFLDWVLTRKKEELKNIKKNTLKRKIRKWKFEFIEKKEKIINAKIEDLEKDITFRLAKNNYQKI